MKNKLLLFLVTALQLLSITISYAGDARLASLYIGEAHKLLSNKRTNARAIIGLYHAALTENDGGARRDPQFAAVEAAAKELEDEFNRREERVRQELEPRIRDLQQLSIAKEEELNKLKQACEKISKEREDAIKRCEVLQNEAASTKKSQEEIQASLKFIQENLKKTNDERNDIQSVKAKLEEEVKRVKAELQKQLEDVKIAKADAENRLKQELESISKEREDAIKRCEVLQNEVDQHRRDTVFLCDRVGLLERINAELNDLLDRQLIGLNKLANCNLSFSDKLYSGQKMIEFANGTCVEDLSTHIGAIDKNFAELTAIAAASGSRIVDVNSIAKTNKAVQADLDINTILRNTSLELAIARLYIVQKQKNANNFGAIIADTYAKCLQLKSVLSPEGEHSMPGAFSVVDKFIAYLCRLL